MSNVPQAPVAGPRAADPLTGREIAVKVLRWLRLNRILARGYYRYVHGFASIVHEAPFVIGESMRRAADSGIAEQGDYYEFGVFKGHTFLQAQLAARKLGLDKMRFFGFDSFAGLPPPRGVDVTSEQHFYTGQYAWPLEDVKRQLTKGGADWAKAFLIEGYFDATLNARTRSEYGMGKASIVLLDSDLYESARLALDFLKDMLVDGAIMIMDDWNAFDRDDSRGERLAMAEFLASQPQWTAEPWFAYGVYGQVFVMHARPSSS